MPTEVAQAPAGPAKVATVSAETAPAADSRSLQQPSQDLASRIKGAKTPAEVRAIMSEATPAMKQTLQTKPKDFTGKEVEAPPAPTTETAPETTEETPVETEAETIEATSTEETPATTTEEVETQEEDGGDGPVSPISAKNIRLNLAQEDKVGRLAISFMKRNRDMPMEEAVARARTQLGIKSPQEQAAAPATPESTLPKTVDDTVAAIAQLRADRKKLSGELRIDEAADLSDKIEDLIQHRANLERQSERQETEQATAYERQFDASEARAVELYPFAADPESAGAKRMREIEADLQSNDDPLYGSPDKPLRIAQMVAAELKIAPKRKGVPAAPAQAAAPANGVPVQKKQVIPSGGSRTTPPAVNTPPAIDAKIRATPNTLAGLRQLSKGLGMKLGA